MISLRENKYLKKKIENRAMVHVNCIYTKVEKHQFRPPKLNWVGYEKCV